MFIRSCQTKLVCALLYSILLSAPAMAQVIELSGTVLEKSGAPVSGAHVHLIGADLITETDTKGAFTIRESLSSRTGFLNYSPSVVFNGSAVNVRLSSKSPLSIGVYNVSGRQVYSFDGGELAPGTYRFALPMESLGAGTYIVKVRHDGRSTVFRHLCLSPNSTLTGGKYSTQQSNLSNTTNAFESFAAQDAVDTLIIAAPGYAAQAHPLESYTDNEITVVLDTPLFTVTFNSSGGSQVQSQTVHYGQNLQQPSNPVRGEQFIFNSWFSDPEFTRPWFFSSGTVSSDMTLYAQWIARNASGTDASGASIKVNQVGYFPSGVKRATVACNVKLPLEWKLVNSSNRAVASAMTIVKGFDEDSYDYVHIIDFTDYSGKGSGYFLQIANVKSPSFTIADDIYKQMKLDAVQYFYHNRSGIAITMPYAGRDNLTRPAGHVNRSPNRGDNNVATWPSTGQRNYTLDVRGGWYDAGDHGKYVVNGGISVWTLMNMYERAVANSTSHLAPFRDRAMNIPESGNGVPDILDEARWQMEFMLKMQVQQQDPKLAGMVHHKIHSEKWTLMGTLPHQDSENRYLFNVSTAATLNLAATAAQASRIWRSIDKGFSDRCLKAAEYAWSAARANPTMYAPLTSDIGGGPYGDLNVSDEFYWAAAELYITTGKQVYRNFITSSKHYLKMPSIFQEGEDKGITGAFTWGSTEGLGTLSLALVPNGLSDSEISRARENMVSAAALWLENIDMQGYGVPFTPGAEVGYPWGSNSFVLNMMIVMGYAYDFTEQRRFLDGMVQSMDYLLGRNSLNKSFVTGYGTNQFRNPHHRFWAYQYSNSLPRPPAGVISGGPNSNFQDPIVEEQIRAGTAPQKVYVDHYDSYSTNEVTINWNAPLAWVTAYLHNVIAQK